MIFCFYFPHSLSRVVWARCLFFLYQATQSVTASASGKDAHVGAGTPNEGGWTGVAQSATFRLNADRLILTRD